MVNVATTSTKRGAYWIERLALENKAKEKLLEHVNITIEVKISASPTRFLSAVSRPALKALLLL